MDVKIKHIVGESEKAAEQYILQTANVPDGYDGRIVTATIFGAPSRNAALIAANETTFPSGLRSCQYTELGQGKIVRT